MCPAESLTPEPCSPSPSRLRNPADVLPASSSTLLTCWTKRSSWPCSESPQFHNPEKFGDLGGGLFEFKSFQIRMPFAYAKNERGVIVVTHGFFKNKPRTPKEEIARAWRIYEEDGAHAKLMIVRKT
jgi:hypothetical protein